MSSNSVTIDGFSISGGSYGVEQNSSASGLRVLGTIFSGEGDALVPNTNGTNTTLISHDAFWDSSSSAPFEVGDAIISGSMAGNLVVQHNLFSGISHGAVILYGTRGSGVTVTDNTVQADPGHPAGSLIAAHGDDNVTISRNSVSGVATWAGIFVDNSRHVRIEQNWLSGNSGQPATWLNSTVGANQDVAVERNDITSNSRVAIWVDAMLGTLEVHFNRIPATNARGVVSTSGAIIDAAPNSRQPSCTTRRRGRGPRSATWMRPALTRTRCSCQTARC